MFGGKKRQELEAQVSQLQDKLTQETNQNADLTQRLEDANRRIRELESRLNDFDLERLKEEARASHAEYEGLKELYQRKNREFDDYKEGAEQEFARDQALQRHNLENEIRDNRQANQDYVASTVKTFGESYNYYLNQIKVLMDALGDVATRTGQALFSGENTDLKSRFGSQMRDVLKSGADSLKGDDGDLILIGTMDEEVPEAVEEAFDAAEEALDTAEEAVEEAVDEASEAVEDAEDALEDAFEDAGDAFEETEDAFEEAAEAPDDDKIGLL